MHGHNYVVIVELESEELNEAGFVRDYRELDKIKKYIDSYLDHRHLNDVWPDMNPSAENIAKRLCKLFRYDMGLKEVFAVTVKETPKTEARYELDFD
jgi:6-pyruvoyltetrahydropterin/6-carboxytetrahydropterin synthase